MNKPGRHFLIDFYDCSSPIMDHEGDLRALVLSATRKSGARIIADVFHQFAPQGVTGVVAIAESHVSIHTWPEIKFVAVDAFTCSDQMDVSVLVRELAEFLGAARTDIREIERGALAWS